MTFNIQYELKVNDRYCEVNVPTIFDIDLIVRRSCLEVSFDEDGYPYLVLSRIKYKNIFDYLNINRIDDKDG